MPLRSTIPLNPRERAEYYRRWRAEHPEVRTKPAQRKVARRLSTNALELQNLHTIFKPDVPEGFRDAVELGLIYWRWAGPIVAEARRKGTLHDLDAMFWEYDRQLRRSRHVPDGWKLYFKELWQMRFPVQWLVLMGEICMMAQGPKRDSVTRVLLKLRDKLREKSAPPSE